VKLDPAGGDVYSSLDRPLASCLKELFMMVRHSVPFKLLDPSTIMFRPSPTRVIRLPISRTQCPSRTVVLRSRQFTTTRPSWNQENQQHKQKQSFTSESPFSSLPPLLLRG
jgi:hypothetical protein